MTLRSLFLVAALFAAGCQQTDKGSAPPQSAETAIAPILRTPDAVDVHSYAKPLDARVTHVALQQSAVGLADLGDRLTGEEVFDLVDFQRLVRLTPTQDRNIEHGRLGERELG